MKVAVFANLGRKNGWLSYPLKDTLPFPDFQKAENAEKAKEVYQQQFFKGREDAIAFSERQADMSAAEQALLMHKISKRRLTSN